MTQRLEKEIQVASLHRPHAGFWNLAVAALTAMIIAGCTFGDNQLHGTGAETGAVD
jgi:hypothetical protein